MSDKLSITTPSETPSEETSLLDDIWSIGREVEAILTPSTHTIQVPRRSQLTGEEALALVNQLEDLVLLTSAAGIEPGLVLHVENGVWSIRMGSTWVPSPTFAGVVRNARDSIK